MKSVVLAVFAVIITFTLTVFRASEAKETEREDSSTISVSKPANKHTAKRKSPSGKHKKARKDKNSASMFKKTLFDAPALKPRQ
jgi:hypothetical protein